MPDKIIVFIDRVVRENNYKDIREKKGAIDALYAYGETILKGNKYVSQYAYLKKKIIELDPSYVDIFQRLSDKRK